LPENCSSHKNLACLIANPPPEKGKLTLHSKDSE
jgi:hypothetical protein